MISTLTSPLEKFGLTSVQRVENALQQLQNGKGILLTDDENRENEGDLIFSAHAMSVRDMAMMIRECSGIVCLCLTNEKANQLAHYLRSKGVKEETLVPICIERRVWTLSFLERLLKAIWDYYVEQIAH